VANEIDRLWPNLPKIELFARRARPGWDRWGADAPVTIGEVITEAKAGTVATMPPQEHAACGIGGDQ
jgi:N6-adenosine-specific RNA methylase IME4